MRGTTRRGGGKGWEHRLAALSVVLTACHDVSMLCILDIRDCRHTRTGLTHYAENR